MKSVVFFYLFVANALYGMCEGYFKLGEKNSQGLEKLSSIVWHAKGNGFSLEPMACQKSGFVLSHDNDKEYAKADYTQNSYTLERGWNFVHAPKSGVDVAKTFGNPSVLFVYIYDKATPAWAGYSPRKNYREMMQKTRILDLQAIEPRLGFYVYASKKITLPIVATHVRSECKKLLEDATYGILVDSGTNTDVQEDKHVGITFTSLYRSHFRRGIYADTRVILFYPKLEVPKQARRLRYGAVEPRAIVEYPKEFEEQKFYVFDYFTKECYEGIFPSKKTPPFPILKKLK